MAKSFGSADGFHPAPRTDFTAIGEFALPPVRETMNLNELLPGALPGRSACFLLCLPWSGSFHREKFPPKMQGKDNSGGNISNFKKAAAKRGNGSVIWSTLKKSRQRLLWVEILTAPPSLPSNLNWSKLKLRDMFDYCRDLQVSVWTFNKEVLKQC